MGFDWFLSCFCFVLVSFLSIVQWREVVMMCRVCDSQQYI